MLIKNILKVLQFLYPHFLTFYVVVVPGCSQFVVKKNKNEKYIGILCTYTSSPLFSSICKKSFFFRFSKMFYLGPTEAYVCFYKNIGILYIYIFFFMDIIVREGKWGEYNLIFLFKFFFAWKRMYDAWKMNSHVINLSSGTKS